MDDDDNGMNGTHGRAEQGSRTPVNDSIILLIIYYARYILCKALIRSIL